MVLFSADYSHELYGSLYKNIGGKGLFTPSAVFSFNNFRFRNFHYVLFLISHYGPEKPPKQQGNQYNCCHFPPSLVHSSFYLKFISPLITNVPLCMFITHSHFNQSAHKQLKAYIKDLSF